MNIIEVDSTQQLALIGQQLEDQRKKYADLLNKYAELNLNYNLSITLLKELSEYSRTSLDLIGGGEIMRKKIEDFLTTQNK